MAASSAKPTPAPWPSASPNRPAPTNVRVLFKATCPLGSTSGSGTTLRRGSGSLSCAGTEGVPKAPMGMASSHEAMMRAAISARTSQSPLPGTVRSRFASPGVESSMRIDGPSLCTRADAAAGPPAARSPSSLWLMASDDGHMESLDTRVAASDTAGIAVMARISAICFIAQGRAWPPRPRSGPWGSCRGSV